MKILKIVYNNESEFIIDIIKNLPIKTYNEFYNIDLYKDKKRAIPIMTRFGTKQVPLIIIGNENLKEINAIWNENSPNWSEEIIKLLNYE
jgi:hypothetical protein